MAYLKAHAESVLEPCGGAQAAQPSTDHDALWRGASAAGGSMGGSNHSRASYALLLTPNDDSDPTMSMLTRLRPLCMFVSRVESVMHHGHKLPMRVQRASHSSMECV
eukprot:37816-Eustigmatos_ZCMA.PRE.1